MAQGQLPGVVGQRSRAKGPGSRVKGQGSRVKGQRSRVKGQYIDPGRIKGQGSRVNQAKNPNRTYFTVVITLFTLSSPASQAPSDGARLAELKSILVIVGSFSCAFRSRGSSSFFSISSFLLGAACSHFSNSNFCSNGILLLIKLEA